jgi:hypothetical protein
VLGKRGPGSEIDSHLNELASGDAQIALLERSALYSELLWLSGVHRQPAGAHQHNEGHSTWLHLHLIRLDQCERKSRHASLALLLLRAGSFQPGRTK